APTTFTPLPLTWTGRSTGSCTPLPDTTPGEPCVPLPAVAPVKEPVDEPLAEPLEEPVGAACSFASSLTQVLPAAGLRRPTTFAVFPHSFTGMCTGSWTAFPARTPGEPAVPPSAPVPPCAGTATAMAPDAAATAITPFRVTRLIG